MIPEVPLVMRLAAVTPPTAACATLTAPVTLLAAAVMPATSMMPPTLALPLVPQNRRHCQEDQLETGK